MKQRALALAIKRIIWAELALSAVIAVPAFAQSQPATTGTAAGATTESTPAAAATPASGTAATPSADNNTATPAGKGVQQLKKFEVTGSLIRQADKTGFNSVQTITAKDISDSGYTNVSDYLRGTSANSASSWSEGQSNNFAAGGAAIALRGLSEKYTLVMVDGQRVAPYAFASNGTDTFFDLNTLPLNIIDRVEIVKTGAVSQYGSDAIAGVVNIITKHDFQGLQLDGSYGGATQGGEGTTQFSVLGGFGDLNSDRFNVTAAASYYHSNGFTLADRDTTKNQDFTSHTGGLSVLAPSFWSTATGPQALIGGCPGGGSVHNAGTNYYTQTPGTICGQNTAESTSISPLVDRLSAKVHATFKIDDKTTAFADLWESSNTTTMNNGVSTVGNAPSTLVWNPATKTLSDFNINVPAGARYNPFGADTPLIYSFPAAYSDKTYSNYWRAATGLKGSFTALNDDWDWAASYSHSQSTVDNTYNNVLNAAALTNIYQGNVYNFANPSSTPNGLSGLYQQATNEGISKLDTIDATLSTPTLFKLPMGDVGFGLGAQFLHESEFIGQGGEFMSGQVVNPILQSVTGERNVSAIYYQVDIPIIRNLTFSQSGRYDHYSDFGGAFSPRYALRYQPVSALTMYGSFNRGFRAPTFVENTASTNIGLQQNGNNLVNTVSVGNPNLQPERTKNYNIGFELSPTRTTDVGFDWYKIRVTNVIGQANLPTVIANNDPSQVIHNPDGSIAYVNLPYQNLGYLDTDGFEGTLRQSLKTNVGTFTLSADWAYVNHFKIGLPGQSPLNSAGNNLAIEQPFGGSFPRWKGNTELSWAYNKWTTSLTWQYTGPYSQAIVGAGAQSVASYSQFNLYATYTGIKHWTIYAGINNIANKAPPFDAVWQNGLDQTGYDQSLYNYYGRYAQIGATYKF